MTRSFQFEVESGSSKELFASFKDSTYATVRISIEAESMDAGVVILHDSHSSKSDGATYALNKGDTGVFSGPRILVQAPDGGFVKGTFEVISTHYTD